LRKFALAVVAASLALAPAGAAALQGSNTTVTIKEKSGDFSGKVKSSDSDCRGDRLVKVKEKVNGKDPTIAKDTSESNGAWDTGNNSADPGDYYAKVKKTSDCGKAKSETVTVN
jgi:hypothetical protein